MTSPARSGRPLIAIDVDGVLAPELDGRSVPAGYQRHTYRGPNSLGEPMETSVYLNPAHGRWFQALAARGADLVWATTWRRQAAEFIAPRIELPVNMPVIEVGPYTGTRFGHSLKHPAVAEFAADRPLAWLDDHFGGKDHGWAEERTASGLPTLLLPIPSAQGLSWAHVEILYLWLSAQHPGNPINAAGPWEQVRLPSGDGVEMNLALSSEPADEVLHGLLTQRLGARASAFELIVQYLLAADDAAAHLEHRLDTATAATYRRAAVARMPDRLAAMLEAKPPRSSRRGIGAALLRGEHGAATIEGLAARDHVIGLASAAQRELASGITSTTTPAVSGDGRSAL
ncbi:HAD domain-containing protein [Amycolatopsis lurida]